MLQPPEAIEAAPQAVPGLESYYEQDLAWTECGDRHICTTVQVPMDYEDPQGRTVDLAVKVAEATGTSLGSLVINPGGPGGSGVEFLDHVDDLFSDELLAAYDVVGFDPRGVGESDSVHCLDSQELDDYFGSTYAVDTEEGWEEFIADETAYGQACLENTGELLNFVDTISAARDMDILRAVLGEPS